MVEVDVDADIAILALKRVAKSVQALFKVIKAVLLLILVVLK